MIQRNTIGSPLAAVLVTLLGMLGLAPGSEAQVLLPTGGIEAPTQPTGQSSSSVRKTARPAPGVAAGARGKILVRVQDLVEVRGQEDNVINGVGLVTGLAGTGDSGEAAWRCAVQLWLVRSTRTRQRNACTCRKAHASYYVYSIGLKRREHPP